MFFIRFLSFEKVSLMEFLNIVPLIQFFPPLALGFSQCNFVKHGGFMMRMLGSTELTVPLRANCLTQEDPSEELLCVQLTEIRASGAENHSP